ncbi:MAG: hypothetical protein ACAF41_22265 [Leptolyngbya sp. BL-A-14]
MFDVNQQQSSGLKLETRLNGMTGNWIDRFCYLISLTVTFSLIGLKHRQWV